MLPTNEDFAGTLDPDDWKAWGAFSAGVAEDMAQWTSKLGERPAWTAPPPATLARLAEPMPHAGSPVEEVYGQFVRDILPFPNGNVHPRFWGWVQGSGTVYGALADFLASSMNPNVHAFDQAPLRIDAQVLSWLKEILGFPDDASGVLLGGASAANMTALAVARSAKLGAQVRTRGVHAEDGRPAVYASVETHSSIRKSLELLGLGSDSLRLVPVDAEFRIDVRSLAELVESDAAQGWRPIAVVGNAGTVNTGALDPLDELADFAAASNLWFHVDGAFGALAAMSPALKDRIAGIGRADSIALDLHKWLFQPYDIGCVLVRSEPAHRATFQSPASYLAQLGGGIANAPIDYADYSHHLSRSFRSLKAWFAFKVHGVERLGRIIERNCAQATYLTAQLAEKSEVEVLAPTSLNIVNFRFVVPGRDAAGLDAHNRAVLLRIQESGLAAPSATVIGGKFSIRCAFTNHRTLKQDLDAFVTGAAAISESLHLDRHAA